MATWPESCRRRHSAQKQIAAEAALDVDEKRVENLKKGIMPIYEPGLEELVKRNVKSGRLCFSASYSEALKGLYRRGDTVRGGW